LTKLVPSLLQEPIDQLSLCRGVFFVSLSEEGSFSI
jgi:hypothetical protein